MKYNDGLSQSEQGVKLGSLGSFKWAPLNPWCNIFKLKAQGLYISLIPGSCDPTFGYPPRILLFHFKQGPVRLLKKKKKDLM